MESMDKMFKSTPSENNSQKEVSQGKERYIDKDGTVVTETPEEHAERMRQEADR